MTRPRSTGATSRARLTAAAGRYHLDGRPIFLRAAELQYFRVPAAQWADSIAKLRHAGCNAIASYVPWSWHEPSHGTLDFTGQTHPQRNLLAFVDAVKQAGLVFLARPGPFIYAEYRGFGYPEWLAKVIPQALARHRAGGPAASAHYHLYSLLHPDYLAQVDRWLAAAAGALIPFLDDPVVAWQLDNETGMLFTLRVGDLDFNPDTIARYRAFLAEEYEDPRLLSRFWSRRVACFADVLPPGGQSGARELSDWQSFLERWTARYLEHLRDTVRSLGVHVPLMVNEPAEYLSPQNPRLKAPIAQFYGYDSYVKVTGGSYTADFPFASSHHPLRFQPFAGDAQPLTCWEQGAGWWDWRARVSPAVTVQALAAGVAHGLKGYNLYAAQDGRDPGNFLFRFGGLLEEDGRPTARLAALARFQEFLRRHEEELTASVELQDPIAFLEYQPYTRLAPEDCLPVPVPGLLEPLRYFAKWGFAGFHAVLATAGYNVPVVDLESATDATLARFAAALFPSRGYVDAPSYQKLLDFVTAGGHLVTFPEPALRDVDGSPLDTRGLWPHLPLRARWCGRARLIGYLIQRWMIPYYLRTRWKTARLSPGALHLSDLIEPALVGQTAPLRCLSLDVVGPAAPTGSAPSGSRAEARGLNSLRRRLRRLFSRVPWLRHRSLPSTAVPAATTTAAADPAAAAAVPSPRIGGEFRLLHFAEGGEPLLRDGCASAGYRVRAGHGTSALLGTVLGGAYTTSRYYTLSAGERLALRRFAVRLVEHVAPRRIIPDDHLEVEAVARLSPSGGAFLFVINRLGRQRGCLRFPHPAALNLGRSLCVDLLYAGAGSSATVEDLQTLSLDLAPDDVLVLRLR